MHSPVHATVPRAPVDRTVRRLAAARRRGEGVRVREWRYCGLNEPDAEPDHLIEAVLAWCRESVASARRPWGIANFDLAVAVSGGERGPRSLSFRFLAPAELYAGDSLLAGLRALFTSERASVSHIAVALFSWGDAAARALPPA